jgi:NAD(P)-dependent dehydrogenase (short-subunit alcohol dehydrogenase family)
MRLADKVAIISGAASGMGTATARMFAREGAKVVIADMLEHEGRQVADAIGASARFEAVDVTREESWAAVVAATTGHFGKLDVLVNNAGISGSAEQDFYSTEAWHRIVAVNATGVFFGIKYAIPAMVANGGGSIVNLSSIAGIIGSEHVHMAYNASEAAVRLMTKSVAVQHAKDKIRANSVHPGIMPPMRTSGRTADPAVRTERMRVIPMRRPGEVDEVAYAILFLASDESSYITGSEIHVDGGAIPFRSYAVATALLLDELALPAVVSVSVPVPPKWGPIVREGGGQFETRLLHRRVGCELDSSATRAARARAITLA